MKKTFKSPISVSRGELLDKSGLTDERFRQLIYDLSVAGNLLEMARRNLAGRLGVTSPQYNILMVIAQYQGLNGLQISKVAKHLHVTLSHVTNEVKKLELDSWLNVTPSPLDKRVRLVKINSSAESKIHALGKDQRETNDHLFRNITKTDFKKLSILIAAIVNDFSETIKVLKIKT